MTVKVGDKVRITHNTRFHTIPLGEEVTVREVDGERVFTIYRGYRYVITDDFEKVELEEIDHIANLAAEVARLKSEVESLKSKLSKVIRCL